MTIESMIENDEVIMTVTEANNLYYGICSKVHFFKKDISLEGLRSQFKKHLDIRKENRRHYKLINNPLMTQYERQLELLREEIDNNYYDADTINMKLNNIYNLYKNAFYLESPDEVKGHFFSGYKI